MGGWCADRVRLRCFMKTGRRSAGLVNTGREVWVAFVGEMDGGSEETLEVVRPELLFSQLYASRSALRPLRDLSAWEYSARGLLTRRLSPWISCPFQTCDLSPPPLALLLPAHPCEATAPRAIQRTSRQELPCKLLRKRLEQLRDRLREFRELVFAPAHHNHQLVPLVPGGAELTSSPSPLTPPGSQKNASSSLDGNNFCTSSASGH